MSEISSNNKRIAKNTLLLYVRMLLIMLVSLYTSRVILNALGVEDYGIYNVVGGFVAMFSVLSGSLSSAISRFLTFELGRGNRDRLVKVFSSSVIIQVCLALIILLLAETLGLWFLERKLVIPAERMHATHWVFHLSILTFCFHLLYVPYHAAIIAHERMGAFAYISIVEAVLKLGVAFLITFSPMDRLVFYAILMAAVAIGIILMYAGYCLTRFEECRFRLCYDKSLLKEMFGFAGWNFIGSSSAVLRDQGGNVIINLFCGPAVNAARGISVQVSHAVNGFVTNFMTALNPQITKNYASGNRDYMMTLIFQGARLSFYMLLLLSLPILLNTHYILELWLKIVPEHTVLFVQLILVFVMSESISNPLITAMLATGNIRNYQLAVGGLQLMNLPVSYVFLRLGFAPEVVVVVAIVISQCCLAARLIMLRGLIGLKVRRYLKNVYFNVLMVSSISVALSFLLLHGFHESIVNLLLTSVLSILMTLFVVLFIGCSRNERRIVANRIVVFASQRGLWR